MTQKQRVLSTSTLIELLQEVGSRTSTAPLSRDEQLAVMAAVTEMLRACGKTVHRPVPFSDLQAIRGQNHVKRALEVVAAGGHHILLSGPPAGGKKLLARALPLLLPAAAAPYPFREPDPGDTASFTGAPDAPGELTLAHGGVLLLANLDAFDPRLHLSLCRAVETRGVALPAGEGGSVFPADFILVATVKPCPCGWYEDPLQACYCAADAIVEFRRQLREIIETCFDLQIEVPLIRENLAQGRHQEEASASVRSRVEAARARQQARYAAQPGLRVNADLRSLEEVQRYCGLDASAQKLVAAAQRQMHLAPQGMLRLHRLARTIADLAEADTIAAHHLAEAIQYQPRFTNIAPL